MAIICGVCGNEVSNQEAVSFIGRNRFDDFIPRQLALSALPVDILVHVANESGYLCPQCQSVGKWLPPTY